MAGFPQPAATIAPGATIDASQVTSGTLDPARLPPSVDSAVSLASYTSPTASAAAQTATLITLLANEEKIIIPAPVNVGFGAIDWQVNPSVPFQLLAGQVLFGDNGGIHGTDPGPGKISRLTVPAGFTGVDIFNIAVGAGHGYLYDFCVDLTGAAATNTGRVFYWASTGTPEESQWIVEEIQVFGPFGSAFKSDTGRRANYFRRCGAFRNGGTSVDTGFDMRGTDWTLNNCIAGAATANIGTGVKAYGSVGRIEGGDIFGWGTNIDTSTGGLGIYIGGGVGCDLSGGAAILLQPGSGGVCDGVNLHNNSQNSDGANPHIKALCLGGWSVANLTVWAESTYANQAGWVVQSGSGGWASVDWDTVNVPQGIGTGTRGVRTALGAGPLAPAQTFGATLALDAQDIAGRNGVAKVTLTAAMAPTITAGADGQRIAFELYQDGTGGWAVTWPSNTSNFPVVFTQANAITSFCAIWNAATTKWVATKPPTNAWALFQEFTTAGTTASITLPPETTEMELLVVGGGGGGASGRQGLIATVRCGGGGGAPGVLSRKLITDPAIIADTFTVVVGAAGTGGAAQASTSTNGNNGVAGGLSSVTGATAGIVAKAAGGNPGQAGTSTSGAGGGSATGVEGSTNPGGAALTTGGTGAAGSTNLSNPSPGGAGGGISAANGIGDGGAGGIVNNIGAAGGTAGTAGAGGGAGPNAGATPQRSGLGYGAGGGGGGASITTTAGTGGAGGIPGGAGGGGGASLDGNASGAGGAGAVGYVAIRIKRG